MSEEIRKMSSRQLEAIWQTEEGREAAEKMSETVKESIEEIFRKCQTSNVIKLGYGSAADCMKQEAEKAGLGKALEKLYWDN